MMQEVIVEFQRTHFHSGVRSGGFSSSRKLDFSNPLVTAAVVELMEVYGVPDDVNIMVLPKLLATVKPRPLADAAISNSSIDKAAT